MMDFLINFIVDIIKPFFDLCTLIAGEDAYLFMVFFGIPFLVLVILVGLWVFHRLMSVRVILFNEMRRQYRIKTGKKKRAELIKRHHEMRLQGELR